MTKKIKSSRLSAVFQVAAVTLAVLFIVFAFLSFMKDSRERVIEQNNSFIQAAAENTADRLNYLIDSSQRTATLMAQLCEQVVDTPRITSEMLASMEEQTNFDYIEFIFRDGMDLTSNGSTADLSDREYFKAGMMGESGKCVIHNSRITNETLLIFYSPFHFDGEIYGVLSCIIRGDTVRGYLSSDYFGVESNNYILQRNGDVVMWAGESDAPDNLLQKMENFSGISESDFNILKDVLDYTNNIDAGTFNYQGTNGAGSAYVTVLNGGEWVLVQSFPSSITGMMTEKANAAGVKLEMRLLTVFLVYLIYLFIKYRIQSSKLVSEKQEMSQIVSATTRLFTRFSLVDYSADSYEYLGGKKSGAPEKGTYTELIEYLRTKYIKGEDGVDMAEVISPEYVCTHLTKEVPYLQFEYEIDMGGRKWENISIICLNRKKGKPVHVLYAIQDVTALKEREQEIRLALKNTSEAAEAANRAKTDFLARMSHDIRTPMNAIMGMTAVAAMHLDDKDRLADCLSKITVSSRHLLALINDVLDMSKIESGKVSLSEEPFSMADMVDSVVTIIKDQIKAKNQTFRVHINDIPHENVIGDTLRLRQVFVNILGNAVKFTPEGGTIIFTIRECESHIHSMACYEFICEDNGMGMDKEFIKTIFDPFSRSKQSEGIEGTGLGMPITRNIVRMMSGNIEVESELGVGSKFTVRLHLRIQEQGDEDTASLAQLRVLVADDDKSSCITTCEILDNIGMRANWVLSGEEAIEETVSAHKRGEDFAAVILDWKMPNKDGIQTAKEIKQNVGEDIPIIILSAYDWTEVEGKAREAGIHAFIEKPLFRSRLVYALKSALSDNRVSKKLGTEELENAGFAGRRVLLVEDNELNMEIAQELLSFTGISVESAENGQIAVEKFKDSAQGYYDLIFMDIQMPVMNGYEATAAIRTCEHPDAKTIPIIAMTANAFSDDIWKSQEAGMNDHVAKPVEVSKLMEALNKWLPNKS